MKRIVGILSFIVLILGTSANMYAQNWSKEQLEVWAVVDVITSYSIHYTKLYESMQIAPTPKVYGVKVVNGRKPCPAEVAS